MHLNFKRFIIHIFKVNNGKQSYYEQQVYFGFHNQMCKHLSLFTPEATTLSDRLRLSLQEGNFAVLFSYLSNHSFFKNVPVTDMQKAFHQMFHL